MCVAGATKAAPDVRAQRDSAERHASDRGQGARHTPDPSDELVVPTQTCASTGSAPPTVLPGPNTEDVLSDISERHTSLQAPDALPKAAAPAVAFPVATHRKQSRFALARKRAPAANDTRAAAATLATVEPNTAAGGNVGDGRHSTGQTSAQAVHAKEATGPGDDAAQLADIRQENDAFLAGLNATEV